MLHIAAETFQRSVLIDIHYRIAIQISMLGLGFQRGSFGCGAIYVNGSYRFAFLFERVVYGKVFTRFSEYIRHFFLSKLLPEHYTGFPTANLEETESLRCARKRYRSRRWMFSFLGRVLEFNNNILTNFSIFIWVVFVFFLFQTSLSFLSYR